MSGCYTLDRKNTVHCPNAGHSFANSTRANRRLCAGNGARNRSGKITFGRVERTIRTAISSLIILAVCHKAKETLFCLATPLARMCSAIVVASARCSCSRSGCISNCCSATALAVAATAPATAARAAILRVGREWFASLRSIIRALKRNKLETQLMRGASV